MGDVLKAFSVCFGFYDKYAKLLPGFLIELTHSNCMNPTVFEYFTKIKDGPQSEGLSLQDHLNYPFAVNPKRNKKNWY